MCEVLRVATHDVFPIFNIMQMQFQSRVGDPPPVPLSLPHVPKKSPTPSAHLELRGEGREGGAVEHGAMEEGMGSAKKVPSEFL